jgi:hypothetical protein
MSIGSKFLLVNFTFCLSYMIQDLLSGANYRPIRRNLSSPNLKID